MPLQATSGAASYDAFGGGVPVVPNYIEEVFSAYLYTGNGNATSRTIQNEIDLSTKGGMVWIKSRTVVVDHDLTDTARGARNPLFPNRTYPQDTNVDYAVNSFLTNGFTLASTDSLVNQNSQNYVSWTFRKQPKFFDIVTWTGNDSGDRVLNHALASTPAFIIIKNSSATDYWYCYHTSLGVNKYLVLDLTQSAQTGSVVTAVSSTTFTASSGSGLNASGNTYVAYVFASNAGGFGLTGTDNVISCGSYTGNGSTSGPSITLGYEPQWIMIKNSSISSYWRMFDNMRGIPVPTSGGSSGNSLEANTTAAEAANDPAPIPTATGFRLATTNGNLNGNGNTMIYIAIRRGPMKAPTDATKVFAPYKFVSGTTNPDLRASFPVDSFFLKRTTPSEDWYVGDRLRGDYSLATNTNGAEASTGGYFKFDYQNGAVNNFGLTTAYISHLFRRAPSFFDEVCLTTAPSSSTANPHNLGAVPELIIAKNRAVTGDDWAVYSAARGQNKFLQLNTTGAEITSANAWGSVAQTSTNFYVDGPTIIGSQGVYYLFATCAGVSKVGSYTGTGTTLQIDCGFTGGARFVLIKRTDSTGDWYVWDSARGIVSGNDPYLLFNSSAVEVTNTDYVDTYSAGFEISSTAPAAINASGGSYIFLAIA
jgi:hypothetical protein